MGGRGGGVRGEIEALKLSQPKTTMQAIACVGGLENLQTPSPSSPKKKKSLAWEPVLKHKFF